jgi:hypothetical protein
VKCTKHLFNNVIEMELSACSCALDDNKKGLIVLVYAGRWDWDFIQ